MKSVVLFSGGLDSTVLLADQISVLNEVIAVSFDYGQSHRAQELAAAKKITKHYGVQHRVVGLSSALLPSALTGLGNIPSVHADEPDSTLVPARNMILLSVGVAIAEAEDAEQVLFGANADDHNGYPDCRMPFINAMCEASLLSSGVEIAAPFALMNKAKVVEFGKALKAPIELSWSCYRGGDQPCLNCGACQSRTEAGA